jgi:hypothetical protein
MDVEDFLPYLGKTDDTQEIKQLLAALGVVKHPKPKKGELDAYVELPEQGLMLTFERPEEGRTSLLALNDVQFYSAEFGYGFSSFPGKLPHGLVFSDGKEAVRRKLGPPDVANEAMGNDIWERDRADLIVEYRGEAEAIGVLHLSMSDEE